MRPKTFSRLIAAFSCCLVLGTIIHRDVVRNAALGKQAYLAKQSDYFDKALAGPSSPVASLIVQMVLIGAFFAAYELIAFLIAKFVTPSTPAPETQQFGQGF